MCFALYLVCVCFFQGVSSFTCFTCYRFFDWIFNPSSFVFVESGTVSHGFTGKRIKYFILGRNGGGGVKPIKGKP